MADLDMRDVVSSFGKLFGEKHLVCEDPRIPFIIEGDSLLLEVLFHWEKDLYDWDTGGQPLMVVSMIEQFIYKLSRKDNAQFVFFDVCADIWTSPTLKFIRELVIEHLDRNTIFPVHRFSSWKSDVAETEGKHNYIEDERSCGKYIKSKEIVFLKPMYLEGKRLKLAGISVQHLALIETFGLHCLHNGVACAFLNTISCRGPHMYAFKLEFRRNVEYVKMSAIDDILSMFESAQRVHDVASIPEDYLTLFETNKIDAAQALIVLTLAKIVCNLELRYDSVEMDFIKVFLYHSLFLKCSVADRCFEMSDSWKQEHREKIGELRLFISNFCSIAIKYLTNVLASSSSKQKKWFDMFDGRFMAILLTEPELIVPDEKCDEFQMICSLLDHIVKEMGGNVLVDGTKLKEPLEDDQVSDSKLGAKPVHLLRMCCDFVDDMIPEFYGELEAKDILEEKEFTRNEHSPVASPRKRYSGDHHWHAARPLEETSFPSKNSFRPFYMGKERLKALNELQRQKGAMFSMMFAKSLAGQKPKRDLRLQGKITIRKKDEKLEFKEDQKPPEVEYTKSGKKKICPTCKSTCKLRAGKCKTCGFSFGRKPSNVKKPRAKGKKFKEADARKQRQQKVRDKVRDTKSADEVDSWIRQAKVHKSLEEKIQSLDKNLNEKLSHDVVGPALKGLFQLLEWRRKQLGVLTTLQKEDPNVSIVVFQLIHDIYRRFKQDIAYSHLKSLCIALVEDFGDLDAAMTMVNEFKSRGGPATDAQLRRFAQNHIETKGPKKNQKRFQLEFGGDFMVRTVNSRDDPRVNFYPDEWQCRLLDVVDARQSALVVAPTSSGKTMVSKYAMEVILEENESIKRDEDKGNVVYVAPTKALVNQTAAEIRNEFGSKYPRAVGIFTRDRRDNCEHGECQVLVTVPQCLEILLLSSTREKWLQSLKYVVVDEVHNINQEGGLVWERILMMLPCPILALSATIGNPEKMQSWLQAIQEKGPRKREVQLVTHNERWADLRQSIYIPEFPMHQPVYDIGALSRQSISEHKSVAYDEKPSFKRLHPISALVGLDPRNQFSFDMSKGLPDDMVLTSKETIQLFDAMLEVAEHSRDFPVDLMESFQNLKPESCEILSNFCITKNECRIYERNVKAEFVKWSQRGLRPELTNVCKRLAGNLALLADLQKKKQLVSFRRQFLPALLLEMNATDQLPAILFSHNRALVDSQMKRVLDILEQAQDDYLNSREPQGPVVVLPDRKHITFDKTISSVHPFFSFVNPGKKPEDWDWWMDRLLDKGNLSSDDWKIRALERGIGIHHSGLPRQYRRCVETMFRLGYLKVVHSTSTLAQGINMPCRTAVFVEDSRYLNPLEYRQMMGRAGRRGFDNVGNVIYFDIGPRKISQLMTSSLTNLKLEPPLTVSYVLRMCVVYSNLGSDRTALEKVMSRYSNLMDVRFSAVQGPSLDEHKQGLIVEEQKQVDAVSQYDVRGDKAKLDQFFYFSLEFLAKNDLLIQKAITDPDGRVFKKLVPVGVAGICSHLSYKEPYNFLFAALLASGVFGDICHDDVLDVERQQILILFILSHIFNRREIPSQFSEYLMDLQKDGPSMIYLNKLSELPKYDFPHEMNERMRRHLQKVADIVKRFNRFSLDLFTKHVRTLWRLHSPTTEVLPVSNIAFKMRDECLSSLDLTNRFEVDTRSMFAAIAGHNERFENVHHLLHTTPHWIDFDPQLIPVCDIYDCDGEERLLNSFALDFYTHGQTKTLHTQNGIPTGDIFHLLQDWQLLILAISNGMKHSFVFTEEEKAILKTQEQMKMDIQLEADRRELYYMNKKLGTMNNVDVDTANEQKYGQEADTTLEVKRPKKIWVKRKRKHVDREIGEHPNPIVRTFEGISKKFAESFRSLQK